MKIKIDIIFTRIMIVSTGLAINGVALLAATGYMVRKFNLYSWGGDIGMAIPTVVCFLLTGTGFLIVGGLWTTYKR